MTTDRKRLLHQYQNSLINLTLAFFRPKMIQSLSQNHDTIQTVSFVVHCSPAVCQPDSPGLWVEPKWTLILVYTSLWCPSRRPDPQSVQVTQWQGEGVKENETCLACGYIPAELSLIKREIGSLHFPPLSLILLILRYRGIRHFSPLKKKQLVLVKWTENKRARRYQNTRFSLHVCAHTHTHTPYSLNSCTHSHWSPALCQIPIALFQHCSISLMIAQLPQLPYTTLRGGEICQTGTGPLLTSHTTVFDSQLGNSKIKGLGKWNSVTQWCESKQTLPWEAAEEEWARHALRRDTKVKWKVSGGKKTTFLLLSYQSALSGRALTKEVGLHHFTLKRRVLRIKALSWHAELYWLPLILIAYDTKCHFPRDATFFFLSDVTLLMVLETVV